MPGKNKARALMLPKEGGEREREEGIDKKIEEFLDFFEKMQLGGRWRRDTGGVGRGDGAIMRSHVSLLHPRISASVGTDPSTSVQSDHRLKAKREERKCRNRRKWRTVEFGGSADGPLAWPRCSACPASVVPAALRSTQICRVGCTIACWLMTWPWPSLLCSLEWAGGRGTIHIHRRLKDTTSSGSLRRQTQT
eukprot:SAG11_NODE_6552_length_1290_cov_0.718724_2_plen_193_part_00